MAHCSSVRPIVFAGEQLPEDRYLDWDFVSHSKDLLQKAKEDWKEKRFPKVPGDET